MEKTEFESFCAKETHHTVESNNTSALKEFFWGLACKTLQEDPISDNQTINWFLILLYVLYFIVFVTGLVGNLLVIYVVARFRKMHTITNFYLANLAIADTLYILIIPFSLAQTLLTFWPFGRAFCKVYLPGHLFAVFASSIFLVVIAIDRYLVVCQPSKIQKYRNPRNAVICATITWVTPCVFQLPVNIYASGAIEVSEQKIWCHYTFDVEPVTTGIFLHVLWSVLDLLAVFIIPVIILVVLYTCIIRQLKSLQQNQRDNEKSITRLLVVVVLVFFICWLPFRTYILLEVSANLLKVAQEQYYSISAEALSFIYWLTFVNSAANPILYAFLSSGFQESFRKAFCWNRISNTGSSQSTSNHPAEQTTAFLTSSV